jgi:uroporphyrinogen decarboxylase
VWDKGVAIMTSHERFKRVFEHKLPDRVPVMDYPWNATIERWNREGLPKSIDYIEYFNLDRYARIFFDVSPQFEKEAIEETEEYIIETTEWGATVKNWKHSASVPEFVDFQIGLS